MAHLQRRSAASPSFQPRRDGLFILNIAGVVVTRTQLVAALQPFLPQLIDIQPLEDGERFFLVLSEEAPSTFEEVS